MKYSSLDSVIFSARQEYGEGFVHLLISWLKCARILILDPDHFSGEVLEKIGERAFLRIGSSESGAIGLFLEKNDLIVTDVLDEVSSRVVAKVVTFETNLSSDGRFSRDLDDLAVEYFNEALALFKNGMNEHLSPTPYLFLDRDGVIIDYVPYIKDAAQVRLREGIVDVVGAYRKRGYRVVMVTNQSGIARGYSSQEDFRQVQNRTLELLAQAGQWIDSCYFATYIANSNVSQSLQYPSMRKPRIGMLVEEAQFWNIDFENSVMIGDNASDVEWAQNAGIGKVFWLDNPDLREKTPSNMANVIQIKELVESLQNF